MESQINVQIGQSNFEIVRDQIGAILKVELDKQSELFTNPLLTGDVYIDRIIPVDRCEGNVINVKINSMDFDNQNQFSQRNTVVYSIDVHTSAKDVDSMGSLSESIMNRLVGLIRKIIQSPIYVKLALPAGIVQSRSIYKVMYAEPEKDQSTQSVRMSRILLRVEVHEESVSGQPVEAMNYLTVMKLEQTEKGYKFIYENQ